MAATFGISFASTAIGAQFNRPKFVKPRTFVNPIRCSGRLEWDPKGLLGPPQMDHIAKLSSRDALRTMLRQEKNLNGKSVKKQSVAEFFFESRVIPDTVEGLVEFFLDTEAQEIESEIARMTPRLNKEFFEHLQLELGKLSFSEEEDRLIELEALQKALQEATAALPTKVEKQAVEYMEEMRGLVLKYLTV